MRDETKRLFEQAMHLEPKERAELAAKLVGSVNALADIDAAWSALLEARARRVLSQELGTTTFLHKPPPNQVRFEIDAEVDLERAATWYEADGRVEGFLAQVSTVIDEVIANPGGFGFHTALPREMGVRRAYLRGFPHALVFVRIRGNQIRVIGVAHEFRAPGEGEISIDTLLSVEEWLTENGVRAVSALGGVSALVAMTAVPLLGS